MNFVLLFVPDACRKMVDEATDDDLLGFSRSIWGLALAMYVQKNADAATRYAMLARLESVQVPASKKSESLRSRITVIRSELAILFDRTSQAKGLVGDLARMRGDKAKAEIEDAYRIEKGKAFPWKDLLDAYRSCLEQFPP